MVIKDLEKLFHNDLDGMYEKEEVASFFILIMEHYYNISRLQMALEPDLSITKQEKIVFFEALEGLKKQKPIQYIFGETEFYGLTFKVNEKTLIPRPETEDLINWCVDCINDRIQKVNGEERVINVLDIGTGSGCIAVALAKTLSNIKVHALDVSAEALKVAKQNAELNGVDISFIKADILELVDSNRKTFLLDDNSEREIGSFDVIISNPPYVRHQEKKEMKANVLDNEPHMALFVDDENPLLFYRKIAKFAQNHLKQNGELFFEINEYLGEETLKLLNDFNFKNVVLRKDVFGKDRLLRSVNIDVQLPS